MEYAASDSSGTDDDLPPSHHNRNARGGRTIGNGRGAVVAPPYPRVQNGMDNQIHRLEREAYTSVLRAFKAQSDVISWEKEGLITELRKELKVSNEEHGELLSRVDSDGIIQRIRESRQEGELQSGLLNNSQPLHDPSPSPTVSASRKRQKTSLSLVAPSPTMHLQGQPSSITGKLGVATGPKGKKPKSGQVLTRVSSMKSMQHPSTGLTGRGDIGSKNSGAFPVTGAGEAIACDPLVGRKVKTRWPEDHSFYEAVITDYNPIEGLHALVYDINTNNETWEWVNLKEIPPEDIQWEGEDLGISHQADRGAPGRGPKKSIGRGGGNGGGGAFINTGRGRGSLKNQTKRDFVVSKNGVGKKTPKSIEILHTESVIKEVERVFGSIHPDPIEMERARKVLKEHELSLIEAISRLADASDGESDGGKDCLHDYKEQAWS